MKHRFKPIHEQVIVITGATSGIGLATAKRAARGGARLVLAARNEEVLNEVCDEIRSEGGKAVPVTADVGEESQVQQIVEAAKQAYGGFDTWINNAGVVVFAELQKLPTKDHERLVQTNYWGTVFGSLAAVEHMRHRPDGGTLINIASINADMPVPILGAYSATKAAVKAYSEVLRMELMNQKAPVRVAVIKPSGIATPISDHGRSHMKDRGKVMPPLYDVEVVARAILRAAQQPVRNVTVGGTGRITSLLWKAFPHVGDRFVAWFLPRAQQSGKPKLPTDNLHTAGTDGRVYLDKNKKGLRFSPYTAARLHPGVAGGIALAVMAAALFSVRGLR